MSPVWAESNTEYSVRMVKIAVAEEVTRGHQPTKYAAIFLELGTEAKKTETPEPE